MRHKIIVTGFSIFSSFLQAISPTDTAEFYKKSDLKFSEVRSDFERQILSDVSNLSYSQASQVCQGQEIPTDLCLWHAINVRVFHLGPVFEGNFNGKFEITLQHSQTQQIWECSNYKWTKMASDDFSMVQYTDV